MVTVKKTVGRPAKAATMSKREQLEQLRNELGAEQEEAIKQAHEYFTGPTVIQHMQMVQSLLESAVPNDVFDTLMKNNLTVVTATADWLTQHVNRPNADTPPAA